MRSKLAVLVLGLGLSLSQAACKGRSVSVVTAPVVWDNLTNFSAVADALTKTSATSAFDAYATSNTTYRGAQKIVFTFPNLTIHSQVGLTDTDSTVVGNGTLDHARYAIYLDKPNGYAVIYEYGTAPLPTGSPVGTFPASPSDTFEVNVAANGTVTYKQNGTTIYTSALSAAGITLHPAAAAFNQGSSVLTAVWTRGSN
jgi:hypothetical protein